MLAQRRTRSLRDLTARAMAAGSMLEGLRLAAESIAESAFDLPFVLFYEISEDGRTAELVARTGLNKGEHGAPESVSLVRTGPESASWPIEQVRHSGESVLLETVQGLFPGLVCGPYPEPIATALLSPISSPGSRGPVCVMVAGLSTRLPLNEAYRSFCELMATAVTTVIANATAIMAERERAEGLAEIDRVKTTFFSNVSHEFRTPLTLLLGPLEDELRALGPEASPVRRERLETAHRNSLRLLRLVNTLLEFARMEDGRNRACYRPTDLGPITADLVGTFRSACERAGLRLVVDCPPLPEPVHVDHEMWEAIVLNLVSNAFKYTADGEIRVLVSHFDRTVELVVADTGIGIPEHELPHIFDRFHRVPGAVSRTHEGTGIGLSFVQQLVKQHGGTVRAESTVGVGTSVIVSIPLGTDHLPAEKLGSAEGRTSPTSLGARSLVDEAMRWLPDLEQDLATDLDDNPKNENPKQEQDGQRPRIIWADDNATCGSTSPACWRTATRWRQSPTAGPRWRPPAGSDPTWSWPT